MGNALSKKRYPIKLGYIFLYLKKMLSYWFFLFKKLIINNLDRGKSLFLLFF